MLLHEITLDTTVLRHQKSNKILGAGIQGVALKTNKPGVVTKVYGLDSLADSYYRYIEAIRHHQDNPFFPRIYKHHVYEDKPFKHGRSSYFNTGVVQMEELVPLKSANLDERVALSLFHNLGLTFVRDLRDVYMFFMKRERIEQAIQETTNETFASSLRILLSLGGDKFDLHSGNWMVRLTSVGPQLVILDPMYGAES